MAKRNFNIWLTWILVAVFSTATTFSQTKEIDSLKIALLHAKDDTSKINIWNELSAQFRYDNDFENTIKYADSALNKAKHIGFFKGEFTAYRRLGNANWVRSDAQQTYKNYSAALALSLKAGDKSMIALAYGDLGYTYNMQNNFAEALKNYFTALRLHEQTTDKYQIASTLQKIGSIYIRQNNLQEAISSCMMARKIFEEDTITNKEEIAGCNHFLGRAYLFQGNYSKAMELFTTALKSWREIPNRSFIAGTTSQIGLVYQKLGEDAAARGDKVTSAKMYEKCLSSYQNSLQLFKALGSTGSIALSYMDLGNIYTLLKKLPQARDHLNNALKLANSRKSNDIFKQIYQSFSKLDSTEGNYRLAFEHYKLYMSYNDSIMNLESTKKAEGYKLQYEFDKKEDSLKKKQFITETKLKSEKKQKYFYWTGLAMLALLSFFVFRNFRNQKKINRLAAEAYANERTELELQSLRAQLNPHFIFNCINSIDAFIHSNDKYNATIYLNKFARLLRNILDSSKLTTVPFTKDIDTLKLYIELEELRNENKFNTVFSIDDDLLNNDYRVPALIIQPFVENAILHGLRNREDNNGILQIEIKKDENSIKYSIRDNGIGRKAAGLIAQNKESSYGMQMSYDRIKLFNKEEKASVQVVDLYKDNISAGTEVKVLLNII